MKENGQMVPMGDEPPREMAVMREPAVVLEEARRAARALNDVIASKRKPVLFNGEQYLEYEDLQTLGRFYGLMAKTSDAEPVDVDGVKGARAKAQVVEIKTGTTVGSAEAYCLRDEPNWSRKPWFQLASMAQTRAGAKALRNLLSWVVVMAGYKPTPAEEVVPDSGGAAVERSRPRPPTLVVSAVATPTTKEGNGQTAHYIAIAKVDCRVNKDGIAWYAIEDQDGVVMLTKNADLGELAQSKQGSGEMVKVETHLSKTGKLMLDSLELIQA